MCVQPLLVCRAREGEDLTRDKSDPKDAVIIARLAAGLHCYEPERADAVWARLRHLGARRHQLTTAATAEVNQVRDLLECAWPAVLGASGSPFRSASWRAAVAVVLDRCAGDLSRVRRLGEARFIAAVRRELPRWGATRPCLRIVRAVFAALADSAGVTAHRPGALERAHLALGDWQATRTRLADVEARMVAVLDDLGLAELVTTIAGLTPVGRGGDPGRDRRPGPVRFPAVAGRARRAVPARQRLRRLPGQDPDLRPRAARPAGGCMAGGLGRAAGQPGDGRPVHPPDHPRG